MIIKEQKTKLILEWLVPVKKLKSVKNDTEYISYRVSLLKYMKRYLEQKHLKGETLKYIEFHKGRFTGNPSMDYYDTFWNKTFFLYFLVLSLI